MRSTCVRSLVSFVLLVSAASALAQHGGLKGRVLFEDESLASFVDVFLNAADGAESFVETTDELGHFEFRRVPVGDYTLYAFGTGMVSDKYAGIRVESGRSRSLDLRLSKGVAITTRHVVRSVKPVDVTDTGTGNVLSGEFIRDMPAATSSLQTIVAMAPGVTKTSSESDEISAKGGTVDQVAYKVDGADSGDPVSGGGPAVGISTFMIEEFEFLTGGWQAKYGERSTGIVLVTTRSGRDVPVAGYQLQFRDTDLMASGVPGIGELQGFWDRSLRGDGTLLESEIELGFRKLGLDPISTLEDDNDPPPRRRLRHALFSGGPIVPGKAHWFVTVEALGDDRGSAFVDEVDSRDQLLVNSRFDWKLGETSRLTVTANVDQQDESGFTDFDAADSTRRRGARGGVQVAGRWIWASEDAADVVETSLQYLRRRDRARPADTRSGVGTRYQVPLPPGGVATYFLGNAFADSDQTVDVLRGQASWTKALGAEEQHETEYGITLAQTWFESFTERGADVVDLRVTDDRAFLSPSSLAGREIANGAPRRLEDGSLQAALYAQDKWAVTPSLTVECGLRLDWQDFVNEALLSPRFGISWDLVGDRKGRLFGNWGLFYDNILLTALQHESNPDRLWSDIVFASGFTERGFGDTPITEIYKESLSTPPTALDDPEAVATLFPRFRDRFVLDEDLRAPKNAAWTLGFEREIVKNTRLLLSYSEATRTNQVRQSSVTARFAQQAGERTIRELVLGSTGSGSYRDWTVELQRSIGETWQLNASYVQSKNLGPLSAPANPLDPSDVVSDNGLQAGDRTHVAKVQALGRLRWGIGFSADFVWQSGAPVSATIVRSDGTTERPFGQNTLRMPSSRQLNAAFRKSFTTANGQLRLGADLQFFNLLGERNVFAGRGRFEVPEGVADPESFLPLRPTVVATGLDVPRSFQVGFSVGF